jgi:hypothetical protein
MADYQSVLTRAVAKLPGASSADMRRAIYDRAREAMLTHLRGLHPWMPESDITREEIALNQAIALVEAKFDATEADPAKPTAAKPAPPAAGYPDRIEAGASPRPAQLGQPTNLKSVPSSLAESAPAAPLLRGPATAPPSPVLQHLPPARPPSASSNLAKVVPPADAHASRSLAVALSIVLSLAGAAIVMRQNPQDRVIAPLQHRLEISLEPSAKITQHAKLSPTVAQSGRETSQPAPEPDRSIAPVANEPQGSQSIARSGQTSQPAPEADGSTAPVASESQGSQSVALSGETSQPAPEADGSTAPVASESHGSQSVAQSGRETSQPAPEPDRSIAPVASEPQGSRSAAQSGRETSQPGPEADRSTAPVANEPQGSQSAAQSGRETSQPAPEPDSSTAPMANEPQGSQSAVKSGRETSQPAPQADGSTALVANEVQGSGSAAQSGRQTSQPAPEADNGALPDAARAAMVIASQDNPQNPVVNLGSTVWSTIPPSPGQPGTVAVKADADIPDLKMHASMTLRKNRDPTLQATHTIDLDFALADGAPITGFKDVGAPQMHEPDTPTSEALTSVKVKVNDVHFLIALANGDQDTARNFDLMRTRAWFEFPLLLNDDRIAKLAFQKSPEGVAMLGKAFDAWK